jgi:hypothetical protein
MNIETHASTPAVLIVYDNVHSGKRAKELCGRLGRRLAPDRKLMLPIWPRESFSTQPSIPSRSNKTKSASETDLAALGLGSAARESPPGGTRQRTSTLVPPISLAKS